MKNLLKLMGSLVLFGSLTLMAAPDTQKDLFKDRIIAKGEGFEVTKTQLEEAFIAFKATRRGIPESQRAVVESNLLDRLIVSQILLKRATDEDKTKGKERSVEFLKDLRTRMPSEELFNNQLKAMGISPEKFESRALEDAVCEQVLEREIRSQVTITDEVAKKYYDENPKMFEQPELAKGAHILLVTRDPKSGEDYSAEEKKARKEAIEKLKSRAKSGEDFTKLAKEYSEHPAAKKNGGEFTIPRNSREAELEAAAFAMQPGQVSEVITSTYGYHVIKLNEKSAAKKLEFAEVSKDIKEVLQMEEVKKRLPAYFEQLKKEAKTEILVDIR